MASISSMGRGCSGNFYWTEFDEARTEAIELLGKMYDELEQDKIKWNEEYRQQESLRNLSEGE